MSKKVKCWGREYTIDRNVEFMAFVPEGETDVHIWADGVFIGTVPELRGYLAGVDDIKRQGPGAHNIKHARIAPSDVGNVADFDAGRLILRADPLTCVPTPDSKYDALDAKISILGARIGSVEDKVLASELSFTDKVLTAIRRLNQRGQMRL